MASPIGMCKNCGAGFAAGAAFCMSCGQPVPVLSDAKVLAERVAATPVYGAPPQAAPPDGSIRSRGYRPMFAAPEPPVIQQVRSFPRKRLAVSGVVVLALLVGGWFWYTDRRDAPVRDALAQASATYSRTLDRLAGAENLADVRAAGKDAAAATVALGDIEERIANRTDDFGRASRSVIDGQQQVLEAAAGLGSITDAQLAKWGVAERELASARDALTSAKNSLAEVESGQAGQVEDPGQAIENVRAVVGGAASRSLSGSVVRLVTRLGAVDTTADIRRIAGNARDGRAVVEAALSGLTGESASSVRAAGAVFGQLAKLRRLDPDHLDAWDDVRLSLVDALGQVGALPPARANASVDHVDSLIASATRQMDRWRKALARAKRQQASARAVLGGYETEVRAQLADYQELRGQLSTFLQEVDSRDLAEAARTLQEAFAGRQTVLSELRGIDPPTSLEQPHSGLINVIWHSVRAVATAYAGLEELSHCRDCNYRDTEGYRRFSRASGRISEQYAEAETAWNTALAAAKRAISDDALPKRPKV